MPASLHDDSNPPAASTALHQASRRLIALPQDLEPANAELIGQWFAAEGWQLQPDPRPGSDTAIILIEIAFPRRGGQQRLRAWSQVWPGVPVVVLSPTFFAEVPGQGRVAEELGVAAVLATPLKRDRLVAVVKNSLDATA